MEILDGIKSLGLKVVITGVTVDNTVTLTSISQ